MRSEEARLKRRIKVLERKLRRRDPNRPQKIRNYHLYALLLENNHYYVGMTAYKGAIKRYEQHKTGKGAQWTKIHKPLEMIEVIELGSCAQTNASKYENELTIKYVEMYGVQRVRGGSMAMVSQAQAELAYNKMARVTVTREADDAPLAELEWLRQERPL